MKRSKDEVVQEVVDIVDEIEGGPNAKIALLSKVSGEVIRQHWPKEQWRTKADEFVAQLRNNLHHTWGVPSDSAKANFMIELSKVTIYKELGLSRHS